MGAAPRRSKKPSGSETRQRQRRLVVRLSETEWMELVQQAEDAGLTLASYSRVRMLSRPTTRAVRRPPVEYAVLGQLMAQLGRIGGNLAQLVKRVNFGEGVPRQEIDSGIADWRAIAAQIKTILGMGGTPRAHDH